jgi:hypothetical protein
MEIIEVLDPDDPSLDWHVARAEPEPPREALEARRGRWPFFAGAASVAVLAVVVVATVSGDDARPVPPPDTVAVLADGRYLIENDALRTYSADIVTPPDDQGYFALLSDGAPADGWVSVAVDRTPATPAVFLDGEVRDVDGLQFVGSVDDPSRVTVVRRFDNGRSLTVKSSRLSDNELSLFVRGITVGVGDGVPTVSWGPPGSGRNVVVTAATERQALLGDVVTQVRYLDDHSDVLTLRVADGSLDQHVRTLQLLSQSAPENVGGRIVATLPDSGEPVVLWEQDGHLLSLSGQADPAALVDLSHDVRQATEQEWQTNLIFLHPDYRVGSFATLNRGDGWEAGLQLAERGGASKYLWWFTLPSDRFTSTSVAVRFDPTVQPFADRVVIEGSTYVFVSAPASSGVTTATVYAGDAPVADLQLGRAFSDVDALFAVTRVDSPGPVRVFAPGITAHEAGLLPDPLG